VRRPAEAVCQAGAADGTWPGDTAPARGHRIRVRPAASGGRRRSVGSAADFDDITTAPAAARDRSDGALVAAVLLRREDAFAGLYRRHVVLVSSMILGSGPDGDDVVAEVFAALRLVPEAFDPAARSESVDEVRRASSDPGPWSKWWAGGAADRGGLPPADVTCRPRGSACGEPGQACRRGAVVERPEPQPDYPAYGRMAAARVIAAGGLSDERTS
jgi:hypothetical protein